MSFFVCSTSLALDYPGQIAFSSTYTGVSFADGMMGLANSVTAQNRLIQGGIQHAVFAWLQDDWRITAKLTLNLGARYELPFQWFEPHGQSATFIPGIQSTVFPGAVGGLGFPGDKGVLPSLVPTDYNGIAPRFGFAYDVTGQGKFLVRGGYGIFFDAVNANVVGVGEPYHLQLLRLNTPRRRFRSSAAVTRRTSDGHSRRPSIRRIHSSSRPIPSSSPTETSAPPMLKLSISASSIMFLTVERSTQTTSASLPASWRFRSI